MKKIALNAVCAFVFSLGMLTAQDGTKPVTQKKTPATLNPSKTNNVTLTEEKKKEIPTDTLKPKPKVKRMAVSNKGLPSKNSPNRKARVSETKPVEPKKTN
jgi:hypothetical protein